MNVFKTYHPIVNFTYFFLVILFSSFIMNPVFLLISLFSAIVYSVILKGARAVNFSIYYMLPLLLVSALMNPLFNHEGATIITYFKSGNPLTLESIVYGISAAVMIIGIIEWFSCFNEIMTSDKIIYLFGKIIPSMSLIISMSLRFVPMFTSQLKEIIKAQKCIGQDISKGSPIKRAKRAINVLSQMITRALENAVDTADSMKSRGFGLEGRTSFSNFDFTIRDKLMSLYILVLSTYITVGNYLDGIDFKYFPSMSFGGFNLFSVSIYFAYFMLCFLPVLIEILEERKWKSIELKI